MGDKGRSIVVGAGIVGLAMARSMAMRGFQVTVVEKGQTAQGASVRNFGMVWPIAQAHGYLYDRAIRSREIWKSICQSAGIWYEQSGSLAVSYLGEETAVLEEFYEDEHPFRSLALLNPKEVLEKCPAVNPAGLLKGLYSGEEMIVDPREAIAKIPLYLKEQWEVNFVFGKTAVEVREQKVILADGQVLEADQIIICPGADLETLFPEQFHSNPLTNCKLQMMRLEAQPKGWRMGPALFAGLSLTHYNSFLQTSSAQALQTYFEAAYPDHVKWGIHVMVSQNGLGELTVGDSHEYGRSHDPFDKAFINGLILEYMSRFARFPTERIIATWHGYYPKMTDGSPDLILEPLPGVLIINGVGGAGMTYSFGLAEEICSAW